MTPIYDKRCKVCNSEHRAEIEKLLAEGWSASRISEWLKETYGEEISYTSVLRHKKNHWNVTKEVKKRISQKESEELFEVEVTKRIGRIESLRKERIENLELAMKLRKIFNELLENDNWKRLHPETFKAMQALYNTATNQVRYTAAEEFKQLDQDTEDPMMKLMELISNGHKETEDDSEEAEES